MTDHIHIDDLSAYLDDELSPAEAAHVAEHLTSCPECRGQLESLSWTVSYVRSAPRAPAPTGAFHVATPGGSGARPVSRFQPWRRRPWPVKAWAMASMAVAVVVLTFALTRLTVGLPGIQPQADSLRTAAREYRASALSDSEDAIPPSVAGGGTEGRGLSEPAEAMAPRGATAAAQPAARHQVATPAEAAQDQAAPAKAAPDKAPPLGEGQVPWRGLLVAAILLIDVVALAVLLRGRRG